MMDAVVVRVGQYKGGLRMKKIALLGAIALVLLFFFGGLRNTFAYVYPKHLNGDPNYILTYGHMNYGTYLDKSFVKVISESPDRIVYSVKTVSGLVLDDGDEWIVPAQDMKPGSMVIMRIYDDPWNVVYTYDQEDQTWKEQDLNNTFGYNQGFLGIVAESWRVLTGGPYPNLVR